MYKGGIQALELLKIDKKTIKALEKNLKEEQLSGIGWRRIIQG